MTTAQAAARTIAEAHNWTVLHDTGTWFNARKGDEVVDVTYNKAGAVDYGALFFNPAGKTPRIMDVDAGAAHQIDHVDRRTQARRARVLSWLTFAEVRAARR